MHARQCSIGAETRSDETQVCVWAPKCARVEVVWETPARQNRSQELTARANGYFAATLVDAPVESLYRFRLNGAAQLFPDPASRFQPDGPHGPSQIVDAHAFAWTDQDWNGVSRHGQVIYEMHIGTFTPEGTWEAAER